MRTTMTDARTLAIKEKLDGIFAAAGLSFLREDKKTAPRGGDLNYPLQYLRAHGSLTVTEITDFYIGDNATEFQGLSQEEARIREKAFHNRTRSRINALNDEGLVTPANATDGGVSKVGLSIVYRVTEPHEVETVAQERAARQPKPRPKKEAVAETTEA